MPSRQDDDLDFANKECDRLEKEVERLELQIDRLTNDCRANAETVVMLQDKLRESNRLLSESQNVARQYREALDAISTSTSASVGVGAMKVADQALRCCGSCGCAKHHCDRPEKPCCANCTHMEKRVDEPRNWADTHRAGDE